MALVVFLRGVNVGGHRTFRPSVLAQRLGRFDVVNVGAAGTFIVRAPVTQRALREALARHLPFDTHVMVCTGAELLRFVAREPFAGHSTKREVVPFVSVLAKSRVPASPLPRNFPPTGAWELTIQGRDGRFVFGMYRRTMKAIGYLGQIDKVFGAPATTRNWNTISTLCRLLT
jgi:uncharacterized protein (DUF1697 family)